MRKNGIRRKRNKNLYIMIRVIFKKNLPKDCHLLKTIITYDPPPTQYDESDDIERTKTIKKKPQKNNWGEITINME
tara:strand:- start:647 stop:874 length:228 start_codon:yes stop_codon:yes gene_type:complete